MGNGSAGIFFSLFIHQLILTALTCEAAIILNEVAYKGSNGQCNGEDWIELFNNGLNETNLERYVLHDDKGKDGKNAKVFSNFTMAANELKVLCQGNDFDFGIGSDDTVTLLDDNNNTVSTTALPGNGTGDQTYAYFLDTDEYKYTTTPTPGMDNIYTEPAVLEKSEAPIILNEIAYAGSNGQCNGKDWIELFNSGSSEVSLLDYVLHDDRGGNSENAKKISNVTIAAGELKVLCRDDDDGFVFGIGSSDIVTLLDSNGNLVSAVTLPGTGGKKQTYAYFPDTDEYKYTTTPTPGAANIQTDPKPLNEMYDEQNRAGADFFMAFPDGKSDVFADVVDIHVDMDTSSLDEIKERPLYENFVPFTQMSVSNSNSNTIITTGGSGKIRTKGQATLMTVACMGIKTVPFQIEFDKPFMGVEKAYFRSAYLDPSYMRDYTSHVLLAKFGLPFLRCRFVRLYLNGDFNGFYIMMEAPTQGYVMQRSFGAFDPTSTAMFKVKRGAKCDYSEMEFALARGRDTPDPYYFERGNHRDTTPAMPYKKCYDFVIGQSEKERADVVKGILDYNNETCGSTMVELGRIDRDFGPKSMEDNMVSFLDSTYYNQSVTDIKDAVDADQWIKNFAFMAVMLHVDSPMQSMQNWYVASTEGGVDDWRIVQYDHNNVLSSSTGGVSICANQCVSRKEFWPILRPTCGPMEDNKILGRLLNDEESKQKYLDYIETFVNMITPNFLDDLRATGNSIKEFVVEDPLSELSISEYEESELGSTYNTTLGSFLMTLEKRLEQVKKQLDAIDAGTLPRDGVYGEDEVCPDWRDSSNGEDYTKPSAPVGICQFDMCKDGSPCYGDLLCVDGEVTAELCEITRAAGCDTCFPYSKCGTGRTDTSNILLEGSTCDSEMCSLHSECFDHASGKCAFDGEILDSECKQAEDKCKDCFPNSRCGGLKDLATDSASTDSASSTNCFVISSWYIGVLAVTLLSWRFFD